MAKELDANADNTIDDDLLAGGIPAHGMQIVFDNTATPKKQWKQPHTLSAVAPLDTSTLWLQDIS